MGSRIVKEIDFGRFFRHPNIIRIYEVIETKEDIILIMECASGGDLLDYINNDSVKKIKYI